MKVKLEPFLRCCVIESEFVENFRKRFRIMFEVPIVGNSFSLVQKQITLFTNKTNVLGDSLCKVRVVAMNSKRVLVRLPDCPNGYKNNKLWVQREQIEWH